MMKQLVAFVVLGVVLMGCSKTTEELYQQAIKNYDEKKYELTIAQLDSLIEKDDSYVNAYIVRANSKLNMKDFEGAIADYTKSLTLVDSANSKANILTSRGSAYFESGKFDQAKEDFLSVTVQNPEYAEAYYLLALTEKELGNRSDVLNNLNMTVELDPAFADGYFELGNYYAEVPDYETAQANYSMAINRDSTNADYFLEQGNVFYNQRLYKASLIA